MREEIMPGYEHESYYSDRVQRSIARQLRADYEFQAERLAEAADRGLSCDLSGRIYDENGPEASDNG